MAAGLRERNKLRRSEQITQAALRLFAERGFDGATIDEIAAEADVSRRTFFRYYARKEDVILDWKRQMADALREAIDARPAEESPLDAAHRALATVAAGYSDQPELTLGLLRLFESRVGRRAHRRSRPPHGRRPVARPRAAPARERRLCRAHRDRAELGGGRRQGRPDRPTRRRLRGAAQRNGALRFLKIDAPVEREPKDN